MTHQKRVFAAGTFDGLHPGHVAFLEFAKSKGGELWVVVARDSTLRRIGKNPYFNEMERLALISSLRFVDHAILGDANEPLRSVLLVQPDVIVLGHDQKVNVRELAKKLSCAGIKPAILRAGSVNRRKYKSGSLKRAKPEFHKGA